MVTKANSTSLQGQLAALRKASMTATLAGDLREVGRLTKATAALNEFIFSGKAEYTAWQPFTPAVKKPKRARNLILPDIAPPLAPAVS